jgi:hypothetical protein
MSKNKFNIPLFVRGNINLSNCIDHWGDLRNKERFINYSRFDIIMERNRYNIPVYNNLMHLVSNYITRYLYYMFGRYSFYTNRRLINNRRFGIDLLIRYEQK